MTLSVCSLRLAPCADVRPDITSYAKNRDTLYDALSGMGFDCVKPDGAFYLFVKAPKGDSRLPLRLHA